MMVSPASRMLRAISLGVFCRLAPSTMAIMRSRNVSPGSLVIRITIQSDSTRVPPVTALRSPPASRITGALSPVMALSSTEAMPSMISPSLGMNSPATTRTTSFLRRDALVVSVDLAGRGSEGPPGSLEQLLRGDGPPRLPETLGLRLAAALRYGLGEVGEHDREPQPQRHGEDEPGGCFALPEERLQEERGGEHAPD